MQDTHRSEAGSPQSILGALLADFSWEEVSTPLPSSIFVALLAKFDIDARLARVAIDRICKKGLLDRIYPDGGRAVRYRMSDATAKRRLVSVARLMNFGEDIEKWDGTWTLLITSVPEARKELRAKLRAQLPSQGFARLYDAVWAKPNMSAMAMARAALKELGIEEGSVFSATYEQREEDLNDPRHAFDLAEIRQNYRTFIHDVETLSKPSNLPKTNLECLVRRIQLMDAWRATVKLDPLLPDELLPDGFERDKARQYFLSIYDSLGSGAERALHHVAEQCGLPGLPLRYFTSESTMRSAQRPNTGRQVSALNPV